jgi:transcriptional regulator with XRE-family HTH domain
MGAQRDELLVAFGRAVRARRAGLDLSQEELADRAGLHRTYVGSLERGERNVSLRNMDRLARALEVELAVLIQSMRR